MHGVKTEAIILKRKNFSEADRILTVFTPYKGKITVLGKGLRRIASRRAGNVELLNRSILYLHKGKNFWILTEAQTLDSYPKIKEDLTLSTYAFHLLELVDKLTAENQENIKLYSELVEVLKKITDNPRQIFIRAFEVKILSNLGFISFLESNSTFQSNEKVKKILEDLENFSWDQIEEMKINENQALELERTLRYYLERVIEGKLKSRQFLKDLKNG